MCYRTINDVIKIAREKYFSTDVILMKKITQFYLTEVNRNLFARKIVDNYFS